MHPCTVAGVNRLVCAKIHRSKYFYGKYIEFKPNLC